MIRPPPISTLFPYTTLFRSTPARQEFILLSDTMGLSALVNIMHDKTKMEEATSASLLGPFFRENTPKFESGRSEEHTSELQSRQYLVCRLLLEKKNIEIYIT